MIAVKPELHYIFQTKLGMGEYPLEVIAENIKELETKNPIVYQNNKTKQTNTQKLNNKHKRTNKQTPNYNKTIKISNKITLV